MLAWLGLGTNASGQTNTNAIPPQSETPAPKVEVSTNASPTNQIPAILRTNAQPDSAVAPVENQNTNSPTNMVVVAAEPPNQAAELGELPLPSSIKTPKENSTEERLKGVEMQLELAREQRRQKNYSAAKQFLANIMATNVPTELKRTALFELALVAQDENKLVTAQQIFSQYAHLYSSDPSLPEILLRQGLIYRQMGVDSLAISKFYSVMATCLKLKLDNIDYYRKLVLQAQVEIADTYYMDGNYDDAADLYNRLMKSGSQELDREQVHFKLVRSLSFKTNSIDVIAKGQSFVEIYPDSQDVPEVRFLLATVLKKIGRNQDAMKQVLLLLQNEQGNADKNPATWIYWQQKAGNEIASQLYKEGDFMSALQIYLNLAPLDKSPDWQLPVWYQTALVYEQLVQPQKAIQLYGKILDRKKELTAASMSPSMESLLEMTKWRKDYLEWLDKAKNTNLALRPNLMAPTNDPNPVTSQTDQGPSAQPSATAPQ